jgi:hypothetical protein
MMNEEYIDYQIIIKYSSFIIHHSSFICTLQRFKHRIVMKKAFSLCLLIGLVQLLFSQNNITLELKQRLGNGPFAMNTPIQQNGANYQYNITRLDYYISEIKITHDGGQVTPVNNVWLLVKMPKDSSFNLGVFPNIQTVEGIEFSIGVDTAHNHLDPSSWPANHPLAPQNPDLHWGWSWGYRFLAIEGAISPDFGNIYEVHGLGDQNYHTVQLSTGADITPAGKFIRLKADYKGILDGINLGSAPIVHSPAGIAATALLNMKTKVFSSLTSSTQQVLFEGQFDIYPNPGTGEQVQVQYQLPPGNEYLCRISDLHGRVVTEQTLNTGTGYQSISYKTAPGIYLVYLLQNNQIVRTEKLLIQY